MLLISTCFNSAVVADVGFEIEDCRRILDARADALAQALEQDRIHFASCETTMRAAFQLLMRPYLLELKLPGDDRNSTPGSLLVLLVNFKAVSLLLTRSAEERQQLLDTGDFVPPVRVAAPSCTHACMHARTHARRHQRARPQRARADVAFFPRVLRTRVLPQDPTELACRCGAFSSTGCEMTGCPQARVGEVLSLLGHHELSLTYTSQWPQSSSSHHACMAAQPPVHSVRVRGHFRVE